jgi:glycosyltransferase involved in cell wall biosynthesis
MTPHASAATDTTVVICCYSLARWDDLSASIHSVLSQAPAPAEILVVVDHNQALLERVAGAFPEVTLIASEEAPGLSGARNTALRHVTTPLVAFLDDDAAAAPGWLEALTAPYADDRVLGVGGRLDPDWDAGRPPWFPREFDWVVGCTYLGSRDDAGPIRNPIGANMSFRTDAIRAAGGFSSALGRVGTRPLGCEETEASIRMSQAAPEGVFWYAPQAIVRHRVRDERATWSYFRARCVAEGRSKASVRRLTRRRLDAESAYATRVLPRGVARNLRLWIAGDRGALPRAAAVVGGLALTTAGYLTGLATTDRSTLA